jgi:CHAD domain-containing protein
MLNSVSFKVMNPLIRYLEKQMETIETNFEAAKNSLEVDVLHDLRVGIKRLKALYQVLDPISEGRFDSKTNFAEVHELFKAVGQLREIQVLKALFSFFAKDSDTETLKEFYELIQQNEDEESKSLNLALQQFNSNLINESLDAANAFLEEISGNEAAKQTQKLLKKRFKQIKELLPEKKDEELMHELRTKVKQACYILEILALMEPDKEFTAHPKRLKLAAELLGQWHDHILLSDVLADFLVDKTDVEDFDAEPYTDLLSQIRLDAKKLLKESRKVLKAHPLKLI